MLTIILNKLQSVLFEKEGDWWQYGFPIATRLKCSLSEILFHLILGDSFNQKVSRIWNRIYLVKDFWPFYLRPNFYQFFHVETHKCQIPFYPWYVDILWKMLNSNSIDVKDIKWIKSLQHICFPKISLGNKMLSLSKNPQRIRNKIFWKNSTKIYITLY